MKTLEKILTTAQLTFSVLITLWSASMVVRCAIEHSGDIYVFLFAVMTFSNYKLLYKTSLKEYREAHPKTQSEEAGRNG